MIELIIQQHLKSVLEEPVYIGHPDNAPTRFVLIDKTGSSKTNRLPSSTFAFQSYAESLYQAAVLNDKVKAAVESMEVLPEIGKIALNSDYNYTDETTKQHRYQAVFDIFHY